MHIYERYVSDTLKRSMQEWRASEEIADVYVVSFYFWCEDDDQRRPCVSLSYNTVSRWKFCTPAAGQKVGWPIASDADEAKWNYAFWLHDRGITAGRSYGSDVDREGLRMRRRWIEDLDLWYTDEEEERDFNKTLALGGRIDEAYVQMLSRIALRLHEEGFVKDLFGKPIPIIVHELEYSEYVISWSREGNPPELVEEYAAWVFRM